MSFISKHLFVANVNTITINWVASIPADAMSEIKNTFLAELFAAFFFRHGNVNLSNLT
jgi:hypothetical protein